MFVPNDRVMLNDTENTHGWEGLTAVVLHQPTSDPEVVYITLDENATRPDGVSTKTLYWPATALVKVTDELAYLASQRDDLLVKVKHLGEQHTAELTTLRGELHAAHLALETFKHQVAEVASRYAIEHDWCSVVTEALEELGISVTRTVTIQVTGTATVELPLCPPATIKSSITALTLALDSDYDGLEITLDDVTVSEV